MRRNDRKKVYDQNARDFKYKEQERVPEFFEDIYDPIYDDEIISDEDYDIASVDSVEKLKGKIRYKRSGDDDQGGGDRETAAHHHLIINTDDQCAKDEILKKHSTILHKSNRYAVLDDDDEDVNRTLEEDAPNGGGNATTCESKELTCNEETGNGSDWEVYHSKYVKKTIIAEKRRIAAAAFNESLVVLEEEETNTDKKKWVDSWCNDEDRKLTADDDGTMVINIDGFFRKKRKAGYGVIIRNRYTGVPFLAAAAQERPVSYHYHELQALNRCLQLAIKYALTDIYIVHTSGEHFVNIALCSPCYCEDQNRNLTHKILCKRCLKVFYDCTDEDLQLHIYPLILEIRDHFAMLESSSVRSYGAVYRKYNKVADCLAKLRMNREEMRPQEFSEELKDIIYEEALNGDLMTAIRQSGYGTDDEPIFGSEYYD